MYDNHQKLKEARSGARKLEQDYKNIGDRLEQEKQKNSRIEQDVKNYEEREKNLCKIRTLQMKRSWTVREINFCKMSSCIRKPTKCLGEKKGADQLHCNHEADQRLSFRYTDSAIPLLFKSKFKAFSLLL